jgi:hypothetical protein
VPKAACRPVYIAYLQRTTSGGLELKLDESNPDAASDDVVLMKEDFSDEIGARWRSWD